MPSFIIFLVVILDTKNSNLTLFQSTLNQDIYYFSNSVKPYKSLTAFTHF